MPRLPALAALAALLAGACSSSVPGASAVPAYPADSGAMVVVGAENFYGDLLHQLGGSKLKVYTFLNDPSADPHQYESNAGNARAVADARLVIENGMGYDAFMERLLKASPSSNRTVINVQQVVGAADGGNPHLWYDPTVMPRVAQAAADALTRADSPNAALYRANLATVLASLGQLSARVADLRSRIQGTPIAFTEPVYGYMASALGLSVLSPDEFMRAVEDGNDPPPAAVAREQDLITGHQVKALLYNNQTETKVTTAIKDLAGRNRVPVVGVSETEPPGKAFQRWQFDELSALEAALGASQ